MRNNTVTDYKGNSYGKRGGRSFKRSKETTQSFHCRDCGTLAYVPPYEWSRAAKPHCIRCGGPLLESKISQVRTLGTKTERKLKNKDVADALTKVAMQPKCWSCGVNVMDGDYLAMHLRSESGCVYEYKADAKMVRVFEGTAEAVTVFQGTGKVFKESSRYKSWSVQALREDIQIVVLGKFINKWQAEELVKIVNRK